MTLHAAVDLGASSGRVMLGSVGPDHLELTQCARSCNGVTPVTAYAPRGPVRTRHPEPTSGGNGERPAPAEPGRAIVHRMNSG